MSSASPSRGTVYSDGEHDEGNSSGEEDEGGDHDDYDPRSSLTRGNDYSSSTYGGQQKQQVEGGASKAPGAPTNIQIQALLDAQRSSGHDRHSTGNQPQSPSSAATTSFSVNRNSAGDLNHSSNSGGVHDRSFGRLDVITSKLTNVIISKKKMRETLAYMDKEQEARAQLLLKHTIDILKEDLLPLNVDPFTVHSSSAVDQVYMLFNSVKVNCVFVVEEDQVLQGMISQFNLMSRLKKKA